MSLDPSLDHSPNQGHYRVTVEYDTHGLDVYEDDLDDAKLALAAFAADGAYATITAWDSTSCGYNLTAVEA